MNASSFKYPKLPEEQYICLKFKSNDVDRGALDTDIARILLENELPVAVRVVEAFRSDGSIISFEKGTLLTLHFIRRPERIYATDTAGNDLYLPLCARQLYQILPMNPLHDDKEYEGTAALIEANPLPERVRIVEAHWSENPGESQEVDDIIEIDRIEERPVPIDSKNPRQKCIIGRCNGVPISFSESMDCATYSTMPSEEFLSLSEIAKKFPLPLRVRKADHRDFALVLYRKDAEHHVVATTANTKHVLSIPITWQGKVEILENKSMDKLFRSLLPPIYPLINTTWGLREPGRCDLQSSMREVAQPMFEILEAWSQTKEGQDFVLKAEGSSKKLVEQHKIRIEELLEETKELHSRVKAYERLFDDGNTPLPPPSPSQSPPSRPPRQEFTFSPATPFAPKASKGDAANNKSPQNIQELKEEVQCKEREIQSLSTNVQSVKEENKKLDVENSLLLRRVHELQKDMQPRKDGNVSGSSHYGVGVNITSYSIEDVVQLLREIRLENYVDSFRQNFVDGMLLTNLTVDELCDDVAMNRIHARRLLLEVERRRGVS